jgi:hypothetical protein
MIYFFHHYELPLILQQARIQQILIETRQNRDANNRSNNDRNNHDNGDDGSGSTANEQTPLNTEQQQTDESSQNRTASTNSDTQSNSRETTPQPTGSTQIDVDQLKLFIPDKTSKTKLARALFIKTYTYGCSPSQTNLNNALPTNFEQVI